MEHIVSESNDTMINSLHFGLPETAQYITDRRFVNYFPSGSNVYNATSGNKNIRFNITGEDNTYLDLSSVRVFANLQNNDGTRTHFLRPLGGLSTFFSRYRATLGGQLVQDINEYNRHCELYNSFKSKDVRDMDDIESSANPRWDNDEWHSQALGLDEMIKVKTVGDPGAVITEDGDHNEWGKVDEQFTRHSVAGIPGANGYVRLGHKPVCGLLESNYYLPLRYAPLELEFTVVSDEHDPVITPVVVASNTALHKDENGYVFTTGDTFTTWELNNLIIRAEVITLDNTVNNNITSHLLQGQSLKLVIPQYQTITQSFPSNNGNEINMNIVKSASKLNGAFITLYRQPRQGDSNAKDKYAYKRFNYFYSPMINSSIHDIGYNPGDVANQGKGFADTSRALTWQIQIANKNTPSLNVNLFQKVCISFVVLCIILTLTKIQ